MKRNTRNSRKPLAASAIEAAIAQATAAGLATERTPLLSFDELKTIFDRLETVSGKVVAVASDDARRVKVELALDLPARHLWCTVYDGSTVGTSGSVRTHVQRSGWEDFVFNQSETPAAEPAPAAPKKAPRAPRK